MIRRLAYLVAQAGHAYPKRWLIKWPRIITAVTALSRAGVSRGARVLDVGPRNIAEVMWLEYGGWRVYAVDLFPTSPRIRRADMERLPYAADLCDAAVLSHVLEHAFDLDRAAQEVSRVVKPGGLVWVAVPRGQRPNRHDRWRFDRPDDVVMAFRRASPEVVHDESNERELRLLLRLRKDGRVSLNILLLLTDAMQARNWIASGMIARLGARGHRVHVIGEHGEFDLRAMGDRAVVGSGARIFGSPFRRWLRRGPLRTLCYVARARRGESTYAHKLSIRTAHRQRLGLGVARLLDRIVDGERLARGIEACLPRSSAARRLFRDVRPDVVVAATAVYHGLEVDTLKVARRAGVFTLGVPASWDTLTSKGGWLVPPDALAVWGTASKQHAVERHGYPAYLAVVTGPVHWDRYGEAIPERPRSLVFVAGTTLAYWPDEANLVRRLGKECEALGLHVWYRGHPRQAARMRDESWPNVTVDATGLAAPLHHCRDLLDRSVCLVSAFSTLCIEAALRGVPSLLIGYGATTGGSEEFWLTTDGIVQRPAGRLVEHARYEHMREVIQWPGVYVCRSEEELLGLLTMMVKLRTDSGKILAVLQACAYKVARCLDGRAQERMVEAIEAAARSS